MSNYKSMDENLFSCDISEDSWTLWCYVSICHEIFNFTQIILGHSVTRSKFGKCIPRQSQQQAKQINKQTVVFQFWILPTKNQLMVFDCKSCDQIMTLTKWVFQVLWLALLQSCWKKWGWRDFSPPLPNFEGSEKRRRT